MKINRLIGVVVALGLATTIISFTVTGNEETKSEEIKPTIVKTKVVSYKIEKNFINYIGVVEAENLVKLSFNQGGILESTYISKGDIVTKGQILSKLDSETMELVNKGSNSQINSANSSLNKVQESLTYSKNNMEKSKKLYEAGVISIDQYDKAILDLEIIELEYKNAFEMVNQAKVSKGINKKRLDDTSLKSDIDGYIVDVLFEPGEFVSPGFPAVILRSKNIIVNTGVSQKDIGKIIVGNNVEVEIDGYKIKGIVKEIDLVPDQKTRTYGVEISLEDTNIPLGSIAKVSFELGTIKGIKVPVSSVMSLNSDFVYVVENKRVIKKNIEIISLVGEDVYVSGLTDGDELIIEGHKRVKEQDDVSIGS